MYFLELYDNTQLSMNITVEYTFLLNNRSNATEYGFNTF